MIIYVVEGVESLFETCILTGENSESVHVVQRATTVIQSDKREL